MMIDAFLGLEKKTSHFQYTVIFGGLENNVLMEPLQTGPKVFRGPSVTKSLLIDIDRT